MYHSYFRGQQYELITIREAAGLMANSKFVPIIEPVKEALGGLERTLQAVCDAQGKAVVIIERMVSALPLLPLPPILPMTGPARRATI